MKILVLMPCDERMVYAATAIYKNLPKDVQDITFMMPMFMEYLIQTKISPNWTYALFDAMISAENIYKSAKKDDLIVFGNLPKRMVFDAVFNFQDLEESLEYRDLFIEKVQNIVKDEKILVKHITKLHEASESRLSLRNASATAEFISSYVKTDPHLEDIRELYKDKLKFKDGGDVVEPSIYN